MKAVVVMAVWITAFVSSAVSSGHGPRRIPVTTEVVAILPEVSVQQQAQRLCEMYPGNDTCNEITASIEAHVSYLHRQGIDFSIVNLTIPLLPILFPVAVDGRTYFLSLTPRRDPALAVALFCRERAVLTIDQCAVIYAHAVAMTRFEFNEASSQDHYFSSVRPSQLCPINQRIYLELDRTLEDSSYFLDKAVEPTYKGFAKKDEPMFIETKLIAQPGPLMILLTNGSSYLHAIFLFMVNPSIQLSVKEDCLVVALDGVDIRDARQRICLRLKLQGASAAFHCLRMEPSIVQESSSTSATLLLPLPTADFVFGLVVNEYNNCICRSPTLDLPKRESIIQPLLPPEIISPPRRHPNFMHDPASPLHTFYDQEWGFYSQNGEDGVLQALFELVPPSPSKKFVEFGVQDGSECNTRYLREFHNWSGVLFDGSYANAYINLHREWITVENVASLFEARGVPKDVDLLVVDIDFNDYHVLQAILEAGFAPRVILAEVNSHFRDARVVSYDNVGWDTITSYFGATPRAFQALLSPQYTLVYCESHGVNCFFVATALWPFQPPPRLDDVHMPPNFFGKGWSYPARQDGHDKWIHLAPSAPTNSTAN
ncbi:hypothetical protein LEN26_007363 [Aphanomyces euteiches]|nr:hypothetical protein LEN26_007363 [Aphanomyces euteiches]